MNKLSVRTKILLVAASFSLPLGVLLYLMVANIELRIDFAKKELAGTAYLRPLVSLLEDVQMHQLQKPGAECTVIAERVRRDFLRMEATDRQFGTLLEFTPAGFRERSRPNLTLASLARKWTAIEQTGCGGLAKRSAGLVEDIRAMIAYAGDTSNLILDPDLDSYYLMDAVVVGLPQTQWRHAIVLQDGSQAEVDGTKMAVHAALLREADLDRVLASVSTAISEDGKFQGISPTLRGAMEPATSRFKAAVSSFIELTGGNSPDAKGANFQSAGLAAMKASFDLWKVGADELDRLLEIRIQSSVHYRDWALLLACLAITVAYALSWIFMRSIIRPLDGLIRSLGPGASLLSECVTRISHTNQKASRDDQEAQIICEELSAHAEDMRKAVYQLSIHVYGSENRETAIAGRA